jgi:hypothetical protein
VDRGSSIEKYDAPRGDQFCTRAYHTKIWNATNLNDGLRSIVYVTPVQGFCGVIEDKLLNSSPYYAQANGQAKASNKILIRLIKKKIETSPKRWHEVLSEALWAHRTSRHGVTKVTPFELMFGQEAVLPVELNLQVHRVAGQEALSTIEYTELMMDRIDKVPKSRLKVLSEIEKEKMRMTRAYNKKVVERSF